MEFDGHSMEIVLFLEKGDLRKKRGVLRYYLSVRCLLHCELFAVRMGVTPEDFS
jgi:hypothetical protein